MTSVARLSIVAVLAVVACAHPVVAQARLVGTVRDESGEPWSGAVVHAVARAVDDDPTVGKSVEFAGATDAHGRFALEVAAGWRYSLFAWQDDAVDGYRTTFPADRIAPGDIVELRQAPGLRHRRVITVDVPDAIARPCRFVARASWRNVFLAPLAPDVEGTLLLPRFPAASVVVDVVDARGRRVLRHAVDPTESAAVQIAVSEPFTAHASARDAATGAPIVDATVCAQVDGRWVVIAALGTDGTGSFDVFPGDELFVAAPEHRPARLGVYRGAPKKRQDVALATARRVPGRVTVGARPVSGAWLLVHGDAMHVASPQSFVVSPFRDAIPVDDDGRFVLPGVPAERLPAYDLWLPPEVVASLPDAWQTNLSPIVPFAWSPADARGPDAADAPADLDLAAFVPLRLRFDAPDGSPALDARVLLTPVDDDGEFVGAHDFDSVLDRAGRLTLLLRPGRRLVGRIDTKAGEPDWFVLEVGAWSREVVEQRVRMRRPVRIRGDVRGVAVGVLARSGVGVELASVPAAGFSLPDVRPPVQWLSTPDEGRMLVRTLARWGPLSFAAPVDAAGNFDIAVPRAALTFALRVPGQVTEVVVDPARDPEPVHLEPKR